MSDEILITPRPTPPPAPPTPQPPPTLPRGMRLEKTVWNYCRNRAGGGGGVSVAAFFERIKNDSY